MYKKSRKKQIIIIGFLIVLVIGGLYKYVKRQNWQVKRSICQSLSFSSSRDLSFCIHPISIDDQYIVVLPAFWNEDSVYVQFQGPTMSSVTLFGKEVNSNIRSISINLEEKSEMVLKATIVTPSKSYPITFYKSQINSIFINTESGSINQVDWSKDKSYKEKGSIMAVSSDGHIEYSGKLSSIHGRGNMTWAMHKKPYSIKIDKKAEIFGLKKAKKFNLLANACDETALRNWIMLNTAEKLKMPNAIRSAYTILYLNGNYNGLYQITNKVEIGKSGVNIANLEDETEKINKENNIKIKKLAHFSIDRNDSLGFKKGVDGAMNPEDITGGYLLDHNFKPHRYAEAPSGFISDYGYPTEIKSPEFASREQVEYISNYYNEMMEAICAPNGKNPHTGMHYSQYIDVDSYIYYYLCSEIFYNLDAVNASLYMYKDKGGKMYCGPIWDYDISMNTQVYWDKANGYNSFFIREAREKDGSLRIFGQLYNHPEYKRRLIEIFNQEFLPIVKSYYQGDKLDHMHEAIATDLRINDLLWKGEYEWLYSLFQKDCSYNDTAVAELSEVKQHGDYWNVKNFLQKRCDFFAEVWATADSEAKFEKITWDFGRIEQYQHISTQVSYLAKNLQIEEPRYLISNKEVELSDIVDASNNPIQKGQISNYYKIIYKEKESK